MVYHARQILAVHQLSGGLSKMGGKAASLGADALVVRGVKIACRF